MYPWLTQDILSLTQKSINPPFQDTLINCLTSFHFQFLFYLLPATFFNLSMDHILLLLYVEICRCCSPILVLLLKLEDIHLAKVLAILTNCLFISKNLCFGFMLMGNDLLLCLDLLVSLLFVMFLPILSPSSLKINFRYPTSPWKMEQMVPEVVLTVTKNNQDSVMKSLLVDHWNSKTNRDMHHGEWSDWLQSCSHHMWHVLLKGTWWLTVNDCYIIHIYFLMNVHSKRAGS